jgi:hypothetical protein
LFHDYVFANFQAIARVGRKMKRVRHLGAVKEIKISSTVIVKKAQTSSSRKRQKKHGNMAGGDSG